MRLRRSKTESSEVVKARDAAAKAKAEREQVEAQWPTVHKIGGGLRGALERNHFGDAIEKSWALRKGTT